MTTIGEIAEITVGFPFPSARFSEQPGAHLLVRGDNIGHGAVRRNAGRTYWWPDEFAAQYELAVDDVLVAMDRPWVASGLKYARVTKDDLPALLVQRVARLRARPGIEQALLTYVVADPRFAKYIQSVQTGTGIPHISARQIAEYPIELPVPGIQSAIASVLGALDDKIAANDRVIAVLDQLGAGLTARALDQVVTLPLGEFAAITMGSSPTGDSLSAERVGVAFHQGVKDFGIRRPVDRIFTTSPVRFAEPGDVLVSVRAPVGRLNRCSERICIGRGLAAVRSERCTGPTLLRLLQADPDSWEAYGSDGTVFSSMTSRQLAGLPVRVPVDLGLLDRRLAPIEAKIDLAVQEARVLAATRDALLPELMSGRLVVGHPDEAPASLVRDKSEP